MSRLMLAFAALMTLGACGIQGDLERPDPMWNSEDAIRRECERQMENNEDLDPRCQQYQTGAQPQALRAPEHDVAQQVEPVGETVSGPGSSIPEVILASGEAPTGQ